MRDTNELSETVLRTKRFDLEPIVAAHAAELFPLLRAPDLYTYIPEEPPASQEALERRFSRWQARQSDTGDEVWLNYAIVDRQSHRYVGTLQATVTPCKYAYIAYFVFVEYWRTGIATEACRELIRALFAGFVLERVIAHVDTRNARSIKLLERIGFERTRTIVGADEFKGASSDEFVYELTRSLVDEDTIGARMAT
jgi:RimJ/RimL family protein N-acetyltransferase